ncbi:MAG: Type 1 glutamine amidotransferase-like domain-containing protein [Clostridia bacterium]|nr:Type 1 glutamine amidotransferase-like domain-containing protein [Clostridia bacterium]
MDKYIVAIGGGELRQKETLKIDAYIASLAKTRAGDRRAVALFVGTASHDSMPYYNTFHKTYTGELGLKTDCALTVYGEMNAEKLRGKFLAADMIYVGGGDTYFMLRSWEKSGLKDMIIDAYERGVIISGLSAGGICWFKKVFTDSETLCGDADKYVFTDGLGILEGTVCPHYDERKKELIAALSEEREAEIYGITNNSALVFRNGVYSESVKGGASPVLLVKDAKGIREEPL